MKNRILGYQLFCVILALAWIRTAMQWHAHSPAGTEVLFEGWEWFTGALMPALLLSAAIQPDARLFQKKPDIHFLFGNLYVMLVLLMAAPFAAVLSFLMLDWWQGLLGILYAARWWWTTRRLASMVAESDLPGHASMGIRSLGYCIGWVLSMILFTRAAWPPLVIWLCFAAAVEVLSKRSWVKELLKAFYKG